MDFTSLKYAFVGTGKMSSCVIESLLKSVSKELIFSSTKTLNSAKKIHNKYDISTYHSEYSFVQEVDIVFLGIKPHDYKFILEKLNPFLDEKHIVISFLAGISLKQLHESLPKVSNIIRTMPNLPISVGKGILAYTYRGDNIVLCKLIEDIFSCIAHTVRVKEDKMNLMTAISGSGPAYIFEFLLYFKSYAIENGLEQKEAEVILLKLFSGSLELLLQSEEPWENLRDKVVSPKGTTESALLDMRSNKLESLFHSFLRAAENRAKELSSLDGPYF